jgi:hypothetical protein
MNEKTLEIAKIVSIVGGAILTASGVIALLVAKRKQIKAWLEGRKKWQKKLLDHEKRIETIEGDVASIKGDLEKLSEKFADSVRDSKDYRKISISDKIFAQLEKFVAQGFVTQLQLGHFQDCVRQYRKCVSDIEAENDMILTLILRKVEDLPMKREFCAVEEFLNGKEK